MKYLLDTCAVSDFIKGDKKSVNRLLSLQPDDLAISSITRLEVEYGLALNEKRSHLLRGPLDKFFAACHTLPYTTDDAICSAKIRAELKKNGTLIGPYDVLIAGCALSRNLILVTSNTKEFERVQDLKREDWRRQKK